MLIIKGKPQINYLNLIINIIINLKKHMPTINKILKTIIIRSFKIYMKYHFHLLENKPTEI